ncbi:hypothetical protein FW774_02390 (plasmid) [Pedobacter sp. BS3]|uniref:hypothetical protein n=1 Tax=Pedobacter sp. BS3 TaxID=2567937 RepID=UPI0011EC346D|nr:hypothetical protein [Pedobacter sp. BS3]TZF85935.1 hypothetical protein FW774_02390 [Pedobacter sp. BS3]
MKEIAFVQYSLRIRQPSNPFKRRKLWLRAERAVKHIKVHNGCVELLYRQLTDKAKALYRTLPEAERVVEDRDCRYDTTDLFDVHYFMTPSSYCYLHCDMLLHYSIEYAFGDCPFEEQLRPIFSIGHHRVVERYIVITQI